MKFIKPVTITDAILVSSTAPETDFAAWASGTTYAAGDKCISTSTHRIYQSVQAGNINHAPTTDDGTWWLDIGPTNRWAMFDTTVGTATVKATPLTVVLDTGIYFSPAIGLLDLIGTNVQVTMLDEPGGSTVYDQTFDLGDTAEVLDWYMYFYAEIEPADTLFITDLPSYPAGRISVTINAVGDARCGTFTCGNMITVGDTRYGARIGIIDYSRKETDDFGVTTVVQRSFAKKIEADVLIDNDRLDYVAKNLAAVRAIPCVWIVADGKSSLTAYGFYKDWGINIAYADYSEASLTIEGLI